MQASFTQSDMKGPVGLTDFLSLGQHQFLTIERTSLQTSGSHKKADAVVVHLFLADCASASDVSRMENIQLQSLQICTKEQVMDLSATRNIEVDNIEGIALGPQITPNSHLLVLVSDNNFSITQKSQLLFFHFHRSPLHPRVSKINSPSAVTQ